MLRKTLVRAFYYAYNISRKGKLNHFYNEVRKANEDLTFDSQSLSRYLSNWGFNKALEENPLMDKKAVKEWTSRVHDRQIHSWAYTGGTYGEPLRIPYSNTRSLVRTASFLYFNKLGGYDLGDPFALIRAKDKSSLMKFLRNETIIIPYDTSREKIGILLEEIKRKKVRALMGYPSVMYEMALYLQQNPSAKKGMTLKSLISVSEALETYKRKLILEIFEHPFIDRYSNEEVGMIAQERSFGEEYHINQYGLVVEVVDPETFLPVDEGKQGKVLVTDICNDLVPIIRYDTGDLATVNEYRNGRLISIRNILGRVTEQITSPEGKPISPLTIGPFIYKPLSKEGRLFPYQFAQISSNEYELRLKARNGEISGALLETLLTGLKEVLGQAAEIKIIIVEEIECQPSGKRPVFKNEITTNKK